MFGLNSMRDVGPSPDVQTCADTYKTCEVKDENKWFEDESDGERSFTDRSEKWD